MYTSLIRTTSKLLLYFIPGSPNRFRHSPPWTAFHLWQATVTRLESIYYLFSRIMFLIFLFRCFWLMLNHHSVWNRWIRDEVDVMFFVILVHNLYIKIGMVNHVIKSKYRRYTRCKPTKNTVISCWVSNSNDPDWVLENLIDPILDAVLCDFQHCNIPSVREPEVLSTLSTIVNKLDGYSKPFIHKIFGAVFGCTLDMINTNFEEFPEHRASV